MVATVQKPAPAFKGTAVVDGLFQDISLSDYLGQWVVLFFYPLDFTFVCPTEILAFNDALPQFKAINTALIGWPRPDLKLPLLADKTMKIARDYGVLIEEEGVALRGLFIIDPKGILRQITETLRLVKAFQFTDEHGEVCPANWTEGSKTMKADPKGSLEYFSSVDANGANGNVSKKRARVD
ncbi:peroxiredoxin [Cerioporus squamosus]|nr:peroxiredoxin [Cerioporus squamosus]